MVLADRERETEVLSPAESKTQPKAQPRVGGNLGRAIQAQLDKMEADPNARFIGGGKTEAGRWQDAADATPLRKIVPAAARDLLGLVKRPFSKGNGAK
jgi:hypothetical protein